MNKALRLLVLLLAICVTGAVQAAGSIYTKTTTAPPDKTYAAVYKALENARFWVVFEANIGANLERMADKWGEDYNQNRLDTIRSMVVCNPWWANRVSNADPQMLALCPLRVNLTAKDEVTSILFARPSLHAQQSPALPVLEEIESTIIEAIESGVKEAEAQ